MANPSRVRAEIDRITAHGDGVYELSFAVAARYTRYLPGQFLHLALDEFDPTTGYWPESRVFSIASPPRGEHVIVVYSVKGAFTSRMERELFVGRQVWLKFPYGSFVIGDELLTRGPLALIAGGTGVSPFWPFLSSQEQRQGAVHLFYGIRKPQHLLFRSDLERALERSWFHLHLAVESGEIEEIPFRPGRLSIEDVAHELAAEFETTNFFLSGPPAMIESFRVDLGALGIAGKQIHVDDWE